MTDHFTRYAIAVPTRNMSAKTTASAFLNEFVAHYGYPSRLHSDQGAQFEGQIIRELCNLVAMTKSHTTPYHPAGNELTERLNKTLLSMLGTPRLAVDVVLGLALPGSAESKYSKYIKVLNVKLGKTYELANEKSQKSKSRQKKYFDMKSRCAVVSPGDRVLVKVVAFQGKHKIAYKMGKGPIYNH